MATLVPRQRNRAAGAVQDRQVPRRRPPPVSRCAAGPGPGSTDAEPSCRGASHGTAPGQGRTTDMTFSCSIDELRAKVDNALEVDAARGVYRGRREAFTDPDVFELEMRYIFEGNWIYLAHESQLPNNGDYLTVNMGR